MVPMVLGLARIKTTSQSLMTNSTIKSGWLLPKSSLDRPQVVNVVSTAPPQVADHEADHKVENITAATRCVVYGLQHRAVQGMF